MVLGLKVLAAALPGTTQETLADWPLGRRNAALARLHCACFGNRLRGWTVCRSCGEQLEIDIDARGLAADTPENLEYVMLKGRSFRLPTTRDLARVAGESDLRRAMVGLVENCQIDAGDLPAWSDEELEAIGEAMAAADPLGENQLAMKCPNCALAWEEKLDIVSFLWSDIDAAARRLLFEIHLLASTYGWSEPEILSMSDRRRSLYLEMIQS